MPGIFINEHLSPYNASVYKKARALVKQKKIAATFTSNGIVHVYESNGPNSRAKKILDIGDLPL
jgi:hypothetical protein